MELYGDEKYLRLSPVRPSGQSLWIYLLTGSFRTPIPGLSVRIGMGALSDRLGWPLSAVKRHWQEIDGQEMAMADWKAGVVFLPRGIAHNEPESTNVVRSWGKVVVPECELIDIAKQSLRGYIARNLSKAFVKAFDEAFGASFGEGRADPSPNQEQEQEQEQERTIVQNTERSELARRHLIRELLAEHERLFTERYGHRPAKYGARDAKHAKDLVERHGFDESCVLLKAFF